MSSKHNRRKRRQLSEVPVLIERIQKVKQHHDAGASGKTYEEANWARLSPVFRNAHNRLRQARGLPTLSPPAIDLYVPPKAPLIKPFDPTDKEFVAATRQFLGSTLPGDEGFSINGKMVK